MSLHPGFKIPLVPPGKMLGHHKANLIIKALNALMNTRLLRGLHDKFHLSDNNSMFEIADNSISDGDVPLHPFQLYKVPSGLVPTYSGSTCYAVRSGHVELRPRWYPLSSGFRAQSAATFDHYDVVGGGLGDDIEDDTQSGLGYGGSYFVLDGISGVDDEIVTAVHYGCYYAFWLEINDNTANAYPTVSVQCRRFSVYSSSPSYPTVPFPNPVWNGGATGSGTYNTLSKEVLPIAILQLIPRETPALITGNDGIGVSAVPPNGLIAQFQTTNFVNRFDYSGSRFLGEFSNSQYRMYYPGDEVIYYGSGPSDTFSGLWVATGVGRNGGAVTAPPDNGAAVFIYKANINRPSVTNPP